MDKLTPSQQEQLQLLEQNANPLARLKSDFYAWQKQSLLYDYEQALQATNSFEEVQEETRTYCAAMERLQQSYMSDLRLVCELRFAELEIFNPYKILFAA